MEDDPGGEPPRIHNRRYVSTFMLCGLWACIGVFACHVFAMATASSSHDTGESVTLIPWYTILSPSVLFFSLALSGFSAFFSASEVAFLSLNKMQIRSMRESSVFLKQLVARLMKRPGSLLATILMGNNIVNVLLSITFAEPLATVFERSLAWPTASAYLASVIITTSLLLFFCEILPKVFAATRPQTFTMGAAIPLFCVDIVMMPLRNAVMMLVRFLFKITRLSQVAAAPFLTDDEFITILSDGEASGVIEEEERHMIEGILEFSDATVEEILSPRPDIVAIKESATAGEALAIVREHEYARMPVYQDDLDHIIGILYAKDLLELTEHGQTEQTVASIMRKPHFVPETMTVADFVKMAQRLHTHIAIVVDEYGGTEGLVTLQDALREVVGDIGEEDDVERPAFEALDNIHFRIAGNFPLDELEEKLDIETKDEEHTTISGFFMAQSDKIPEPGDKLEYSGICFTVEAVSEKRITSIMAEIINRKDHDQGEEQ